jgi:preprotein translocase subunit SecE
MKGLLEYLRNSRAELGRVTWPTRDEVIQATQATIFFVFLTILFLLVADFVLGNVIRTILKLEF